MQAALRRFALSGLAALVIVAVPVVVVARSLAVDQALTHVAERTRLIVEHEFAPKVTDAMLAGDAAAVSELDDEVDPLVRDGHVIRVKIWDIDGTILYSDLDALVGQQFDFPDRLEAQLESGAPVSVLGIPGRPDNIFEADLGEFVEVYVKATGGSGSEYIFELYYLPDEINRMEDEMLGILPVVLVALALLQLLQLAPAIRMARRLQNDGEDRRRLLQQSIAASDHERQRLARALHDDVIQDLAALAYSLEAREQQQAKPDHDFQTLAKNIVQGSIRSLRRITVALYPPDLSAVGLPLALDGLGDLVRKRGADWQLEMDASAPAAIVQPALLYRVAREAVTNAAKHARAQLVRVSLTDWGDAVLLEIVDDGDGFSPADAQRDGHLGLRILRDTVHDAGGTLLIESAPAAGTRVAVTLPSVGA
ncbi:ATP-binding protein [Arthrobacter sp. NPDC089319]|uniref:sensor histidine kinase n=1 Tax=Arthrobacter sp. NPDC089319 TaxID=3155915 RepID=UPI003443EB28